MIKNIFASYSKTVCILAIFAVVVSLTHFPSISAFASTQNYYVSTTGNDSNAGSLDTPFKTIQKCADISSPGAVCNIRGGSYGETINITKSGTESEPIIFQAYNNEKVTIDGRDVIDPNSWTEHDAVKGIYKTNAMNWDLGLGNIRYLSIIPLSMKLDILILIQDIMNCMTKKHILYQIQQALTNYLAFYKLIIVAM